MPICGWTSHKLQVNSDPHTKTKSFSTPDTKKISVDPQTEIRSSSTPHTETKSTSTTQTKTKLISMLTLKPSDLRPVSKILVIFDHHHPHKNQINQPYTKNKLISAGTRSISIPRTKTPSLSIPTLKPSQIRSLTQKSSWFRHHYWNQVNSIPTLKLCHLRCLTQKPG